MPSDCLSEQFKCPLEISGVGPVLSISRQGHLSLDRVSQIVFMRASDLITQFALACVASVSVWFRRPKNGILGFGRARNKTYHFSRGL